MIRTDGTYKIYILETKDSDHKKGEWYTANLDHFGAPPGFTASDRCWQVTGVYGCFNEAPARQGLTWIRARHPGRDFRLVCTHITQLKTPVAA